jgi:signal transduction histidine kinase
MEEQPAQARQALLNIKETSRQTLRELRGILQVLRETDEVEPRAPAPGLDNLDTLLETTNRAGVPTRISIHGEVRPLAAAVDLAAYRVIQESLTNVVRHAGPASAVVSISYEPSRVVVEVSDDGRGSNGVTEDAGHGIAGMRERVAASGGGLEAGNRPGGGFAVRVWFPTDGSRE